MKLIEPYLDNGLTIFGLVLVAVMMLVRWIGYRIGAGRPEKTDEGVAVLIGGLLGLMSFVLAFNLSTATSRLEDRRDAGLAEAQAIGTAWLQAHAVPESQGAAIAALLEDYIAARQSFATARVGAADIAAATDATARLQAAIWANMSSLLATRVDPQTVSLTNALTHTFDMTTAQTFSLESSLPSRVLWLLLVASITSIGCLGYFLGLIRKPHTWLSLVLAAIWSGVMALIVDLGVPRVGSVNIDPRPYIWTTEGFDAIRAGP